MTKKQNSEKKPEVKEVKTIPSIGGDVTPVFIDNTKGKQTPEFEKRYNAAVESSKKQKKGAQNG